MSGHSLNLGPSGQCCTFKSVTFKLKAQISFQWYPVNEHINSFPSWLSAVPY